MAKNSFQRMTLVALVRWAMRSKDAGSGHISGMAERSSGSRRAPKALTGFLNSQRSFSTVSGSPSCCARYSDQLAERQRATAASPGCACLHHWVKREAGPATKSVRLGAPRLARIARWWGAGSGRNLIAGPVTTSYAVSGPRTVKPSSVSPTTCGSLRWGSVTAVSGVAQTSGSFNYTVRDFKTPVPPEIGYSRIQIRV